jgi:hypothetical protein
MPSVICFAPTERSSFDCHHNLFSKSDRRSQIRRAQKVWARIPPSKAFRIVLATPERLSLVTRHFRNEFAVVTPVSTTADAVDRRRTNTSLLLMWIQSQPIAQSVRLPGTGAGKSRLSLALTEGKGPFKVGHGTDSVMDKPTTFEFELPEVWTKRVRELNGQVLTSTKPRFISTVTPGFDDSKGEQADEDHLRQIAQELRSSSRGQLLNLIVLVIPVDSSVARSWAEGS